MNHYILPCQNFAFTRLNFLNIIFEIHVGSRNDLTLAFFTAVWISKTNLWCYSKSCFIQEYDWLNPVIFTTIWFRKKPFDVNTKILNLKIQFLKDSGLFHDPLIRLQWALCMLTVSHFFEFIIIWRWTIPFSNYYSYKLDCDIYWVLCSPVLYVCFVLFLHCFICYCWFVKCV